MERDGAAGDQQHGKRQDQETVFKSKIDKAADHLLLHRALQGKRILNYLCAGIDFRDYFLHVPGQHVTGHNFKPPKMSVVQWHIKPLAIMQVQNRSRRHHGVHFCLAAMESGSDEHADAHQSGIFNFETNLRGTDRGIENRAYVTDPRLENLAGVGIEMNIRIIANLNLRQRILVNVTNNPDMRICLRP